MFVQEIAPQSTVAIEISKDAHSKSEVIQRWKDWIYQKRRHLSTAPLYKIKFKILLALYPFAQLLFLGSIILLFIFKINIIYIIST